jgi:tRNA threonylcarbamoyl adenosine modification protein YeaZ
MIKYALALHTSSSQLGLAISNFETDTRSQVWDLGRELSNTLHQHLADFVSPQTWDAIAFIAVSKGPGSFTSTRIGLVTARTLGQQLKIPVFAFSSLAIFAWSIRDQVRINQLIPVQMSATKEQIYGAVYQISEQGKLIIILPDILLDPEQWQEKLAHFAPDQKIFITPENLGDNVSDLLTLAYQDWQAEIRPIWSEALPFYGM